MSLLPSRALKTGVLMRMAAASPADGRYLVAIVAAASCFVLLSGAARHYLGYDTETDFVGSFVPDAERLLRGDPLLSEFHPPLYSIVLALVYLITGEWLRAGLLISWISGIVALVSSFLLFKELCNRAAGWGALLALLGSGVFVRYWAEATSDVFFLAIFMLSCLLAARAFASGSVGLWAACGFIIGLCLMTRTNAITLVVLAVAPFLSDGSMRAKVRSFLALLGGMALPIAALVLYAAATGSNLLPGGTYLNVAMTYFSEGSNRMSGDARYEVAERFQSMRDVLLHDPIAMAKIYVYDLYKLLANGFTTLVEMPLYYAILPGMFFLIGMHFSAAFLVLAVVVVAQIMLVNMKFFEPRLYLFLVPWLGAAIGEIARRMVGAPWPPNVQPVVVAFLVVMLLSAIGLAGAKAHSVLSRNGEAELSEVVPLARRAIEPGAVILARKPHVSFYTGRDGDFLPDLSSVSELNEYLRSRDPDRPLYIFYGREERLHRPQYAELAREAPPPWLETVARSPEPGGWVLFRVP